MAFEIPKSVRQIGQISGSRRVYVEDYVWTFSRQLARQAGEQEVAGVLLGKTETKKGEKYFFVSGMVEIKDFRFREDDEFSQEMWTSIFSDIKENFTNLEILGWFYSKAEMPPVCTEQIRGIHGKNFAGNDRLLYLYDEGEEEDAFFLNMAGTLEMLQGYYIYYEKNPEMQEYMISHKTPDRIDKGLEEAVLGNMREILEKKQEEKEAKQTRNSYGFAIVAAAVAIVCGVFALHNQNTLKNMEQQVMNLKESMGLEDESTLQKDTMVETIAGNVATVTPAAVSATPQVTKPPEAVATPIVIAKKYDLYVVKEGDSLSKIAGEYYSDITKAEKIRKYNNLKKNEVILVGQKLKLPLN